MCVEDYSLIESDNHAELVTAVADACRNDGWFPHGGICVWVEHGWHDRDGNYTDPIIHYTQALVKYAQRE